MRIKDDEKREALFHATIKIVNELGFASSSVAKIAKEANISAATLYIYHKNKEDLLVSTFIRVKRKMSVAILADFDDTLPLRDILENVWTNLFGYVLSHPDRYKYSDQFTNSPYISLVPKEVIGQYFNKVIEILNKGVERKILKDVDLTVLSAFLWAPAIELANLRLHPDFEVNEENIDAAFSLAWDAIKL